MREMVLNHASLEARDPRTVSGWIIDLIDGIKRIIDAKVVPMQLHTSKRFSDIQCAPGISLDQIGYSMFKSPNSRDEAQFLMILSSQTSLLTESNPAVSSRLSGCELRPNPRMPTTREDSAPLLYCAIADGIAVGFPSNPIWDSDELDVNFDELLPNDEFESRTETIDNLTRSEHAIPIVERHQAHLRSDVANFKELWELRQPAFPNLVFGPDVENQLPDINPGDLFAIIKKLSMLDEDTGNWQITDSAMPEWSGNVTPESYSVRNNPALIGARRFRSNSGSIEIFEWHARFGSGGRIHLRFDAQTKEVEIGYIGKHLPI